MRHAFDPGYSGLSPCMALVMRNGEPDHCGLPADAPVHQLHKFAED